MNAPTASPGATQPAADARARRLALWITVVVVLLSRVAYWPAHVVGKDSPQYFNSLHLDSTYNVPMPGNIGWVLSAKAFTLAGLSPLNAYTLVSILVSTIGAAFLFLLCSLFLRPWSAAGVALAAALSTVVWYHAIPVMSYETWICIPPAIAYFGVRYWRERNLNLLYLAALATGIGTILRPDMVITGGVVLGGVLLLGRAPLVRGWGVCGLICAICCCVWFFTTALVIGSVPKYLDMVRHQSEFVNSFSASSKGIFEGLLRNGGKFGMIYGWGAVFVALPAAWGLGLLLRRLRSNLRGAILGAVMLAPSLYFGIWLFMGNAGLVLPAVVASFVLAGFAFDRSFRNPRHAAIAIGIVGLLGALQFILTPILPERNQRDVVLNVTLFRYSGAGITHAYNFNLVDYGIDSSLKNVLQQVRNPEPIPHPPEIDPRTGMPVSQPIPE